MGRLRKQLLLSSTSTLIVMPVPAALAAAVGVAPSLQTSWLSTIVPIVSVLSTTAIAAFGIWQRHRIDVLSRRFIPKVDFTLGCRFFGPQAGFYIAELSLNAINKGEVRREFESLEFRVRGLKRAATPGYWGDGQLRAKFPEKLMEDNMIRDVDSVYYVEPGVSQLFSYTTLVSEEYSYILLRARIIRSSRPGSRRNPHEDARDRIFTVERVYEVRANVNES